MRLIEMEYNVQFHEFALLERLRDLGDCTIWSAGIDPKLLILEDPVNRRLVHFEYLSYAEFDRDRRLVMAIDSDEGDASSGVPAWLAPVRPIRSAGFAQPLPRPGDDE